MSKSFNWNNPRDNRDVEIQRFCAVFFALALATVIMACTVSFRYQEEDGDTMPPETTTTAAASTSRNETPVTISPPETTHAAPTETLPMQTAESKAPSTSAGTKAPATSAPSTTAPKPIITAKPVTDPPPPVTEQITPAVTEQPPVTETSTAHEDDDPARLTARPFETDEPPAPPEVTVRVPENTAVENSYFSDALFLGDSRTVGLSLYSGLKSNYYSQQGLNISSVVSGAFIASGDAKLTLSQALDTNNAFTKVYVSFGINEIGWPSTDSFIKSYSVLIDLLKEKLPNAHIYVQEILPMAKATAENSRYKPMGGNGKVAEYNSRLYTLCEEKGLYYIALTEVFADENGDLNVTDSFDGIHLGVKSSKAWVEYLKTHTVP